MAGSRGRRRRALASSAAGGPRRASRGRSGPPRPDRPAPRSCVVPTRDDVAGTEPSACRTMRSPFTQVPLSDPRSSISTDPSPGRIERMASRDERILDGDVRVQAPDHELGLDRESPPGQRAVLDHERRHEVSLRGSLYRSGPPLRRCIADAGRSDPWTVWSMDGNGAPSGVPPRPAPRQLAIACGALVLGGILAILVDRALRIRGPCARRRPSSRLPSDARGRARRPPVVAGRPLRLPAGFESTRTTAGRRSRSWSWAEVEIDGKTTAYGPGRSSSCPGDSPHAARASRPRGSRPVRLLQPGAEGTTEVGLATARSDRPGEHRDPRRRQDRRGLVAGPPLVRLAASRARSSRPTGVRSGSKSCRRYGVAATLERRGGRRAPRSSSSRSSPRTSTPCSPRSAGCSPSSQTVLSIAAAIPTAAIERHLARHGPGRARDAEHARRRSTRAWRASPPGAHASEEHMQQAEELLAHVGSHRSGSRALHGRGDGRLRLRAGLLRAAGRVDDRGRASCSGSPARSRPTSSCRRCSARRSSCATRRCTRSSSASSVTSPGGTTIAAIRELEQAGVRAAFLNAIQAAMTPLEGAGGRRRPG